MIIKKFLKKIRLKFNSFNCKKRKKQLKTTDFSIISNNCYAGIIYQYLGLKYNTPTVGLYFYADEYIKFVTKFDYYIKQKLKFINTHESKYYEDLCQLGYNDKIIGKLDDVEIVFLHYQSQNEALEKWNRRCSRLSKNLIFKFNDQNLCTEKHLEKFDSLDLKNKICFVSKKHPNLKSTVWLKKYCALNAVKEDYYTGHKYFNIIDYINKNFSRKKILHLISTSQFSGAENVACQIINGFKENRNYEMCYCSSIGSNLENLMDRNIPIVRLNQFSYSDIKKAVSNYKPDIIHAHDVRACLLAALFSKKCKIIAHIHGNHENMRSISVKSMLFLLFSRKFKKIIWVSNSSLDSYIFKKNVKNKSIILYNVIDSSELYKKLEKDNNHYQNYDLIFLGRLTYPKNPERLIQIIIDLAKIKKDIKVAIVGTGDLEKTVKAMIKEAGIDKNIDLFGFVANPYKILNSSKMMIMTSRYEGTPMCALEAIALGKPIISTPTDGLIDIINNENGFLSNDNKVLEEKILQILENKRLLSKMSENAKECSKRVNNSDNYLKKIKEIYEGDYNG